MNNQNHFEERLEARGQLKVQDELVDFLLQVEYDKYESAELTAHGSMIGKQWDPFMSGFLLSQTGTLEVAGQHTTGETLQLLYPFFKASKGSKVSFHCSGFDWGIRGPLKLDGGLSLIVQIPYSAALEVPVVTSRSALGHLSSERTWQDGITCETSLGQFLVGDYHHFYEDEDKRTLTRIKATELRLTRETNGEFNAFEIFDEAQRELTCPPFLVQS